MKIQWFRSWKMGSESLKKAWLMALCDPSYWITIIILIIICGYFWIAPK